MMSPVQPFEADLILCPKCGHPLRRVTAGEGSFTATCDNKIPVRVPVSGGGSRVVLRPCGQHVHVLGAEGVAFALPISRAQFDALREQHQPARDVYRAAGVIPGRPHRAET
jgi:hypothetical protein